MRYRKGTIVALFVLFSIICTLVNAATPGKLTGGKKSTHPDWFKESFLEISEDASEASTSGKHLILFMHLNNCPYCYKMLEENFANASYTQFIKDNFDVIVINIRGDRDVEFNETTSVTEKELAKILKVTYTPTILFLNKDNKTVLRLNGYRSAQRFKYALDYVHQKGYTKTSLNRFIEGHQHKAIYQFRDHPQFKPITDLKTTASNPLAIIVEDKFCDSCNDLQ